VRNLAAPDESKDACTGSVRPQDLVLEGLPGAKVCFREKGKREDLKGADSDGSVRANAVFFNTEINVSQSTFGFVDGVSHFGRR
jgi:hypothetical protein